MVHEKTKGHDLLYGTRNQIKGTGLDCLDCLPCRRAPPPHQAEACISHASAMHNQQPRISHVSAMHHMAGKRQHSLLQNLGPRRVLVRTVGTFGAGYLRCWEQNTSRIQMMLASHFDLYAV